MLPIIQMTRYRERRDRASPKAPTRITAPAPTKSKLNAAVPSSLPPVVGSVLGVPTGVACGVTAGATAVAVGIGVSVAATVGTGVSLAAGVGVVTGLVPGVGVSVACRTGAATAQLVMRISMATAIPIPTKLRNLNILTFSFPLKCPMGF